MSGNPDIGTRLVAFAKHKFGDAWGWQKQFSAAIGMDPGSARKYLIGQTVPGSRVQEKLRGLGCNIEWLMTGKGSMVEPQNLPRRSILLRHLHHAGGTPTLTEQDPQYAEIPKIRITDQEPLAYLVDDESMSDLLRKGDVVFVAAQHGAENRDLCLVTLDTGEQFIRHVYFSREDVILLPKHGPPRPIPKSSATLQRVVCANIAGEHLRLP